LTFFLFLLKSQQDEEDEVQLKAESELQAMTDEEQILINEIK